MFRASFEDVLLDRQTFMRCIFITFMLNTTVLSRAISYPIKSTESINELLTNKNITIILHIKTPALNNDLLMLCYIDILPERKFYYL